ncbi:MAG: peptidylprolyl isomerase [Bacteroidetes bacterium]|nr:peptidylprolyl isomerase [Bacteroidota bacterium]
MLNRPFSTALLSLFLLTFVGSSASTVKAQEGRVLDEIVAVVGNYIILQSDVDGMVLGVMSQQQMEWSEELWQEALVQLLNDKVLVTHAQRDTNLVVTDQQVDQMLDSQIEQIQQRVGGQARLEEIYGKSVLEVKADLREDYRDRLLADEFRRQKMSSIKATPTDVRQWFAQIPTDSLPTLPDLVRVSHIVKLPKVTEAARNEAMEIITSIRDSVVAGASTMEEMAQLFSDDPGSAPNGGLYENMGLDEVVPEFAAVASRAAISMYSRVFETQFGLHFLRVNARRGDRIDYNHILISFDDRKVDSGPAIADLTQIRDSILTKRASFEALAREESEEEFSKSQGGRVSDPNTGERNLYVEALGGLWQRTLSEMDPGDISEPSEVQLIDGRRAFHIVRLEARIPSHRVDISTDYELIEERALQDKQQLIMEKWLLDLKKSVYIDLRGRARELNLATDN